jgi:flagellar FliJ protein
MSFHFRLQKVLDLKETEKDWAQNQVSLTIQKKHHIEEEIARIECQRGQLLDEMDHQTGIGKAAEWHTRHGYVAFLEQTLQSWQGRLGIVEQELETNKAILTEKAMTEKIWQQWREREQVDYLEKEKKEEQAMFDELAVIRHFRRQSE